MEARSPDTGYRVRTYNGYEIDLSLSEDRLFSNFFPACRRCIRKAARSGVVVEEAHDAQFVDDYYEQLKEVFARQGLSPTYPINRVQALIRQLGPTGNLLLLRAFDNQRRCIATGIFPAMNDRAYFWGGASRREYQHLRPNESVMWYAIRYWKSRGIRFFDFSGAGDYKRKYGTYEIGVPWLRVSRYPFLPMMRDAAMLINKLRQRWHGALQLVHSPQYGFHRAAAPAEAADA
jgi:GNAT acetyltransferase-like protein